MAGQVQAAVFSRSLNFFSRAVDILEMNKTESKFAIEKSVGFSQQMAREEEKMTTGITVIHHY